MRVHTEEVFGPVATLYRVGSIEEAVELANGTDFGLGANAWTNDESEGRRLISELEAGMVFINGNVTSFPELPFGGIKTSGYGRELTAHGIREFCNLKSVWVKRHARLSRGPLDPGGTAYRDSSLRVQLPGTNPSRNSRRWTNFHRPPVTP